MAQKEIIELLKKYVLLLNAQGISVKKAYLFGSHASGLATEDSDIDIMIVSDKHDESDDRVIGKMWRLTRQVDPKIEPLLVSMDRFMSNEETPLIATIKNQGIAIA
ncbi:MAG: nucleotidyltransferase domain-containing protein [Salinivirgaceae bacterium]